MNRLFASQLLATFSLSACFIFGPGEGGGSTSENGGSNHGGGNDDASSSNEDGGAPPGSAKGWQAANDPVCGGSISQISFVDDLHGFLLASDQLPAGTQSVYYT